MTNRLTPLTLFEKITDEKRRRTQVYATLDYLFSGISYFDFFSRDAFSIVKKSHHLAHIFEKKTITSEILLFPFFYPKTEISYLLRHFNIREEIIGKTIATPNFTYDRYINMKEVFYGADINDELDESEKRFAHEVKLIFEKASENALLRFKTPIISSEILFITIMEEKRTKAARMIKKMINNEGNWYLLRYHLMRRIHNQESTIRGEVPINQQYFAYLLKIQLPDIFFNRLIRYGVLRQGVSLFRNTLVSNILNENIFNSMEKEIKKSIEVTSVRQYSS
jgi:hypothetical protein